MPIQRWLGTKNSQNFGFFRNLRVFNKDQKGPLSGAGYHWVYYWNNCWVYYWAYYWLYHSELQLYGDGSGACKCSFGFVPPSAEPKLAESISMAPKATQKHILTSFQASLADWSHQPCELASFRGCLASPIHHLTTFDQQFSHMSNAIYNKS